MATRQIGIYLKHQKIKFVAFLSAKNVKPLPYFLTTRRIPMNPIQTLKKTPTTDELYIEFLKSPETKDLQVRILSIAAAVFGGQTVTEMQVLILPLRSFQNNDQLDTNFRDRIQKEVNSENLNIDVILEKVRTVALRFAKAVQS